MPENKSDSINTIHGNNRIINTIFLNIADSCKPGNNITIKITTTIDKTPITKENKEILFFATKTKPNQRIAQKQIASLRYPTVLQHI
ncbi:conserved hypothetical protein [Francisella hispaniensis]|uniref:Uncharacterized protein n=1 Tax=Francisella hispaniensis TaxID=622488 RepID=F4BHR0_9GAMM|nr:conserved hypothetical protein [Francisella hispaniensis]